MLALGSVTALTLVSAACGGQPQSQPPTDQGAPSGAVASAAPGSGAGTAPNGTPGQGGLTSRETPAPELPTTTPDVTGIYLRRQDVNLFIGTVMGGRGSGNGGGRANGTPGAAGTRVSPAVTPTPYNGPTTEVLTNSSTKLYKDVTPINFQRGQNNGNSNTTGIQQQVQAVNTLDDLFGTDTANGTVTVWGTKNGEQLTATVVVYRPRQAPGVTPTPTGQ
ncbi:MAG TPA: hypothetical protein VGK81_09345 [Anaerolineae bacterium]